MRLLLIKRTIVLGGGLLLVNIFFFQLLTGFEYEIQMRYLRVHNRLKPHLLMSQGISKIIVRAFLEDEKHGGVYFNNSRLRVLRPEIEKITSRLTKYKLVFWAWMITRDFKWLSGKQYFDYKVDSGRRNLNRKLDLFNPEAVELLLQVYKELAKKNIQGILIQDDFVIRHNEGFSNWGKAQFEMVTGFPAVETKMMAKNDPYNTNWMRIKIDKVNRVLKQIVIACKDVKPTIQIGLNIHYETPVAPKNAQSWYAHNLREINNTGIDFLYLMAYHRQIKRELKLSERANRIFFKKLVDQAFEICKEKLVVKLQIRDWKTKTRIPAYEVRQYIQLIPRLVKRVCLTPVEAGDLTYIKEVIR